MHTADAGLRVDIVESRADGWAKVRFDNGWEGWVDGRRLLPAGPETGGGDGGRTRRLVAGIAVVAALGGGGFLVTQVLSGSDDGSVETSSSGDGDSSNDGEGSEQGSDESTGSDPGTGDEGAGGGDDSASIDEPPTIDELIAIEPDWGDNPPDLSGSPLGSSNREAAQALVAELEATGADLSGFEMAIYAVRGTDGSLLAIDIDESAINIDTNDVAGETLAFALIDSQVLTDADVTELAINVTGSDDGGPYVLTMAVSRADLIAAGQGGVDLFDVTSFQAVRG